MQTTSKLVNFCLDPLVQSSCSSVSADNYHITNLVSTDVSMRSRGFRVEHYMRPPVQLDFEFQFPLNVAYIIIQPELTPSSEMRLEVAASCHTATTSTNLAKVCPNAVVNGNQTALILENKSFKKKDGSSISISKPTDILSLEVEGSFVNRGGSICLSGGRLTTQSLKHPNILQKLRQLRVTVRGVSGPKPVALKSMEVWGSPSDSCSPSQLNLLQTSLSSLLGKVFAGGAVGVKLYRSSESPSLQQKTVVTQQDSIIPNDLHRGGVNTGSSCTETCYLKTWCSLDSRGVCGGDKDKYGGQGPGAARGEQGVCAAGGSGKITAQEVGHIKEQTSENKKSPKPQQGDGAVHLEGCRRDSYEKPCGSHFNKMLPPGKNGNPVLVSGQPTHNTRGVNDEENSSRSSCGFATATASESQQQQGRQTQSTFIEREIPSEFLDNITYDIMSVPMVLPSGYCVDRSTLEKLSNSDALCGRAPSDPFTGIPFSGMCKPEFSSKLKLQLDDFLSSCSVAASLSTAVAGRTVGTAGQISAHIRRVEERTGNRKRIRDEAMTSDPFNEQSRKRLKSPSVDASYAPHHSQRTLPPWTTPSTQSSSYGADCPGSSKKDQRPEDRILHHSAPCSSQTGEDRRRNQFEQEVAGSLDRALKQLLSDS